MSNFIRKFFIKHWMKNQFKSVPLRKYYLEKFNIKVGLYSYGCFDENRIARGTIIGRYCSFAPSCYIFNGNHGIDFLSLHPYAYNPNLGYVKEETISRSQCVISDDVWIGHNAIITPSVTSIGRGAVIAAGAVVTKNVPPYAVMAGNPAKPIKFRFTPQVIESIEASEWWLKDDDHFRSMLNTNSHMFFKPAEYFSN